MTDLYTEYNTIPQHVSFVPDSSKPRQRMPKALKWSGENPVPAIGATVRTSVGAATVLRYFSEHGWLGLLVQPPDRYSPCHVYGAELVQE